MAPGFWGKLMQLWGPVLLKEPRALTGAALMLLLLMYCAPLSVKRLPAVSVAEALPTVRPVCMLTFPVDTLVAVRAPHVLVAPLMAIYHI